jgi:hypothetical protein
MIPPNRATLFLLLLMAVVLSIITNHMRKRLEYLFANLKALYHARLLCYQRGSESEYHHEHHELHHQCLHYQE